MSFFQKIRSHTLVRHTIWLTLGEGASRGLQGLFFIIVARVLGAADYGILSFVMSLTSIFAVIADFGLGTVLIRDLAKDKQMAKETISNILGLKIVLSAAAFILTIGCVVLLGKSTEVTWFTVIGGVWAIAIGFLHFFHAIFRAYEKMYFETISKSLFAIPLLIIGTFGVVYGYGLSFVFWVYLILALIACTITYWCVRRYVISASPRVSFSSWKALMTGGSIIFVTSVGSMLYSKIDTVMLSVMQSDTVVGWYSAVYQLIFVFTVIPSIITNAIYPRLSAAGVAGWRLLMRSSRLIGAATVFLMGGIFVGKQWIIPLMYGDQYLPSIAAFLPLAMAFICFSLVHVHVFYLYALHRERYILWVTLGSALVNVVLNYLLIPHYSFVGAAYASALTQCCMLGTVMVLAKKMTAERS